MPFYALQGPSGEETGMSERSDEIPGGQIPRPYLPNPHLLILRVLLTGKKTTG